MASFRKSGGRGGKGEIYKPPRPWPAESKPQFRNPTLSSTHIAPPPPPTRNSSKNPSLCKQGHRKASTLVCYQFSFSSLATWLDPQLGDGRWLDSSPFLLYLFSPGQLFLPRGLSSLGSLLPARWRGEAGLSSQSKSRPSLRLSALGRLPPPSFLPSQIPQDGVADVFILLGEMGRGGGQQSGS